MMASGEGGAARRRQVEEGDRDGPGSEVPERTRSRAGDAPDEVELVEAAVARMRAGVMATVFALVGGVGLCLATVWLLVLDGANVGQHLGLLRHYFPGYSVTWPGALVGLAYGMLTGGIVGWSLARLYNALVRWRNDPA